MLLTALLDVDFSIGMQVEPLVKFVGEGTYCFTIRPSGIVTNPNQKCAKNDVKKLEIRSCEPHGFAAESCSPFMG